MKVPRAPAAALLSGLTDTPVATSATVASR
jgi:hypothetical protein